MHWVVKTVVIALAIFTISSLASVALRFLTRPSYCPVRTSSGGWELLALAALLTAAPLAVIIAGKRRRNTAQPSPHSAPQSSAV
ncbi:MAG: hypothetical protein ABWU84_11020 [Pyrobaculum sp.]|uniref:hypothetical protein n=1 Tax=Pyrobaculum sp. TaxID=2004705 RepID=UPI003EEE5AEE